MAASSHTNVMSHWYTLIENLRASPMEFYASVEAAIARREIPGASTSRVDYHEGGAFSAKREYFRVARETHLFDICAAPFGTGFFVSWRLSEKPLQLEGEHVIIAIISFIVMWAMFHKAFGLFGAIFFLMFFGGIIYFCFRAVANRGSQETNAKILSTPIIGIFYDILFHPMTYYRIDTALMFQESIRNSVMEVVDEITNSKGLRALSELERKPILSELFQR